MFFNHNKTHTKLLTHELFPAHIVGSHLWCGWKVSVLVMISVANVSRVKQYINNLVCVSGLGECPPVVGAAHSSIQSLSPDVVWNTVSFAQLVVYGACIACDVTSSVHPVRKRVVISLQQYMNLYNKWENRDSELLHFSVGQERCQKVMKNNPKITSQRSGASEPCMWDYGRRFSPPRSKDEEVEALRGSEPHPRTEQEGQSRLRGPVGPDSALLPEERHTHLLRLRW